MKYSTIAIICLAIAGIITIYQFQPSKTNTALTSRKINSEVQNNIKPDNGKKLEKDTVPNNLHMVKLKKEEKYLKPIPIKNNTNENISDNGVTEFAKKLRTTYVAGIYCQQVADDGTYRNQKHYFYNMQKEQFIEIPNLYYIRSTDQLGDLTDEYLEYGSKTDEIVYKGQRIKIWTMK